MINHGSTFPDGTPTFIHHWTAFQWVGNEFRANISQLQGFTSEPFDGEASGFAIEGKSGQIYWFCVTDEVLMDDDMVDYWTLRLSTTSAPDEVRRLRGLVVNA